MPEDLTRHCVGLFCHFYVTVGELKVRFSIIATQRATILNLICSFKLGVELAEDLVEFLANDIGQHIQSSPGQKRQQGTHLM